MEAKGRIVQFARITSVAFGALVELLIILPVRVPRYLAQTVVALGALNLLDVKSFDIFVSFVAAIVFLLFESLNFSLQSTYTVVLGCLLQWLRNTTLLALDQKVGTL